MMVATWHARAKNTLRRRPWLHWGVVYAFGLTFFFSYRLLALDAIVHTFGSRRDDTFGNQFLGILLGLCEDTMCVTYMATLLWAFDWSLRRLPGLRAKPSHTRTRIAAAGAARSNKRLVATRAVRFVGYLLVCALFTVPPVVNGLLVRIRQMRFTFKFLEMYINQKDAAGSLEVSPHERNESVQTSVITAVVLLAFCAVACVYLDLSHWTPLHALFPAHTLASKPKTKKALELADLEADDSVDYEYVALEQGDDTHEPQAEPIDPTTDVASTSVNSASDDADSDADDKRRKLLKRSREQRLRRAVLKSVVVALALVALPVALLVFVQQCASPVIAMIGLNTSLSELFRLVAGEELLRDITDGSITSAHAYLDNRTEQYTLLREDALVRRTLGFQGDLAFDVRVDQADLPNVLVIAVESFRYHDSQYLVGNNTYLLKDANVTVTPNFDRWAKRGIAFRNFWSSWQTSRSLESILFGQLPFDSVTESGTTGGRTDVELSGMPQLFKAKGYEPTFTTGCRTDYDQWNKFLPSHGFDTVLDSKAFKRIAERELGIDPKDWPLKEKGGKARGMSYWGVHDDVAFDVLGNILTNKTREQQQRVQRGEPKTPFFVNHYTISSHFPYEDRPMWYENYTKPDFSALYTGERFSEYVKSYVEMRYFTDMALGKFLDRMERQGILNDTIIFITGDHGQGPEFGKVAPEYREVSTARVATAMIAEGRLGKYAGSLVDRLGEHYDLLNTLADIVGVPDGGFLQTSVGRSLKRKAPTPQHEAQHVVWSNNPVRKMGAVRGHLRLRYDVMTNQVALHDTETDHDMQHDLLPDLPPHERKEWLALRDAGRRVSAYFKKRWTKKCLLKATC